MAITKKPRLLESSFSNVELNLNTNDTSDFKLDLTPLPVYESSVGHGDSNSYEYSERKSLLNHMSRVSRIRESSYRTNQGLMNPEIEEKYKKIKRDNHKYRTEMSEIKEEMDEKIWSKVSSDYQSMNFKYDSLINLLFKQITKEESKRHMLQKKLKHSESMVEEYSENLQETSFRMATFERQFSDMYEMFRVYIFSKNNQDIGNDLTLIDNQISSLKDFFSLKLNKFKIQTTGDSELGDMDESNSNNNRTSEPKQPSIVNKNEEISYNLSQTIGLGQTVNTDMQSKLDSLNFSNIKNNIMTLTRNNHSKDDSKNISVLDQIINRNLFQSNLKHTHFSNQGTEGENQNNTQMDFDVINSMIEEGINDSKINQLATIEMEN